MGKWKTRCLCKTPSSVQTYTLCWLALSMIQWQHVSTEQQVGHFYKLKSRDHDWDLYPSSNTEEKSSKRTDGGLSVKRHSRGTSAIKNTSRRSTITTSKNYHVIHRYPDIIKDRIKSKMSPNKESNKEFPWQHRGRKFDLPTDLPRGYLDFIIYETSTKASRASMHMTSDLVHFAITPMVVVFSGACFLIAAFMTSLLVFYLHHRKMSKTTNYFDDSSTPDIPPNAIFDEDIGLFPMPMSNTLDESTSDNENHERIPILQETDEEQPGWKSNEQITSPSLSLLQYDYLDRLTHDREDKWSNPQDNYDNLINGATKGNYTSLQNEEKPNYNDSVRFEQSSTYLDDFLIFPSPIKDKQSDLIPMHLLENWPPIGTELITKQRYNEHSLDIPKNAFKRSEAWMDTNDIIVHRDKLGLKSKHKIKNEKRDQNIYLKIQDGKFVILDQRVCPMPAETKSGALTKIKSKSKGKKGRNKPKHERLLKKLTKSLKMVSSDRKEFKWESKLQGPQNRIEEVDVVRNQSIEIIEKLLKIHSHSNKKSEKSKRLQILSGPHSGTFKENINTGPYENHALKQMQFPQQTLKTWPDPSKSCVHVEHAQIHRTGGSWKGEKDITKTKRRAIDYKEPLYNFYEVWNTPLDLDSERITNKKHFVGARPKEFNKQKVKNEDEVKLEKVKRKIKKYITSDTDHLATIRDRPKHRKRTKSAEYTYKYHQFQTNKSQEKDILFSSKTSHSWQGGSPERKLAKRVREKSKWHINSDCVWDNNNFPNCDSKHFWGGTERLHERNLPSVNLFQTNSNGLDYEEKFLYQCPTRPENGHIYDDTNRGQHGTFTDATSDCLYHTKSKKHSSHIKDISFEGLGTATHSNSNEIVSFGNIGRFRPSFVAEEQHYSPCKIFEARRQRTRSESEANINQL